MIDPAYIQAPGSAEGMLKVETIVQSGSGEALTKAELDHLATRVIDGAFQAHSTLGPGLPESVYEICLVHELAKMSIPVRRQVALPVQYDGVELEGGFRVDLLVADNLIVEIKSIERVLPIHGAQVLTYLKLTGSRLGLLLNFNVVHMRDVVKRIVYRL